MQVQSDSATPSVTDVGLIIATYITFIALSAALWLERWPTTLAIPSSTVDTGSGQGRNFWFSLEVIPFPQYHYSNTLSTLPFHFILFKIQS